MVKWKVGKDGKKLKSPYFSSAGALACIVMICSSRVCGPAGGCALHAHCCCSHAWFVYHSHMHTGMCLTVKICIAHSHAGHKWPEADPPPLSYSASPLQVTTLPCRLLLQAFLITIFGPVSYLFCWSRPAQYSFHHLNCWYSNLTSYDRTSMVHLNFWLCVLNT